MKWYKRDPAAALEGMIGLTLEERGAYNTLLDLIYARAPNGVVDDHLVINAANIRPQVWRRLKASLMAKGKVREVEGRLTANRVETEVQTAVKLISKGARLGRVSTLKRAENNELAQGVRNRALRDNHNHIDPSLTSSFFLTAASSKDRPVSKLATALPTGALARSPTTDQTERKQPSEGKPPHLASRADLETLARKRASGGGE